MLIFLADVLSALLSAVSTLDMSIMSPVIIHQPKAPKSLIK